MSLPRPGTSEIGGILDEYADAIEALQQNGGSLALGWQLFSVPGSVIDCCTLGDSIYVVFSDFAFRRYDTGNDTWHDLAGVTAFSDDAQVYGGGLLIVYGGNLVYFTESSDHAGHTLSYDIVGGTWTQTRAPMPIGVNYFAGGFDEANGKVYIAAGAINGTTTAATQIYDLATDTWTSGADAPLSMAFGRGVFFNGLLWTFYGLDSTSSIALARLDTYNPDLDSWDDAATYNPPITPIDSGVVVLDGKILLFGGSIGVPGGSTFVISPLTLSYDIDLGAYSPLVPMPFGGESVGAVANGKVYAFSHAAPAAAVYGPTDSPSAYNGVVASTAGSQSVVGVSTFSGGAGVHGLGTIGVRGDGVSIGLQGTAPTGVIGVGVEDYAQGVRGSPGGGAHSVGVLADTLALGNSADATIPGTVVKKFEVFDDSGNSLGFVPVYDAIT